MKTNNLFFGLVLFLMIPLYSCSKDDAVEEDFSEAKTMLNVSYGSNAQQVFDLYLPANRNTATTKTWCLD